MSEWLAELPSRARRGSRPRCLLLTEGHPAEVANRLSEMVRPYAIIDHKRHQWLPRGRFHIAEAKLGDTDGFLDHGQRESVTAWWLARTRGANTPNWDIAATATIEGHEGLVLVEAKAHESELDPRGKSARGNPENHERIGAAIAEASAGLNAVLPGWDLTIRSHYQLANRFAWAWKVASMGVPVVLVYLGFLGAEEMAPRCRLFQDADSWRRHVADYSRGAVPAGCWENRLDVKGTPLIPLIRSLEVKLPG